MSGEERPERHAQAAGETTRSVWTESMYADARPWPGIRVLVDRSLPLGRRSGVSYPDVWLAAVAPSAALWRWYGVHEARYAAFADRYERELGSPCAPPGSGASTGWRGVVRWCCRPPSRRYTSATPGSWRGTCGPAARPRRAARAPVGWAGSVPIAVATAPPEG
ncbi:DUF488 family protein [Streptomyces albulus]|nr:DUF488 family protein [Streptomyces noursei]